MIEPTPFKLIPFALLLSVSVPAQGTWVERFPVNSPSPRSGASSAYDAERQKVVLFGGWDRDTNSGFDDTWEWDGTNWSEVAIASPPPPTDFQPMVYDAVRKRVVLFGGALPDGTISLDPAVWGDLDHGETWEYDGSTWTRIQTPGPPLLQSHAMSYDSDRQVTVLFSGVHWVVDPPTPSFPAYRLRKEGHESTWEYDGSTWTERFPATAPEWRESAGMVYDQARRVIVLQGGGGANGQIVDTWEYDGIDWVQRNPQPQMPADIFQRYTYFSMSYDETRERVMLVGGSDTAYNDGTWQYDGNGWTRLDQPLVPPGRTAASMAYDSGRQRQVLFGGTGEPPTPGGNAPPLADTWELSFACGTGQGNTDLARLEVNFFGQGSCRGPFEVPVAGGGFVTFDWEGSPTMPFSLLFGPRMPDALPFGCYGIPNIGTPPLFQDVQPLIPFFIIGLDGTARQTFSVPPFPAGTMINLQGVVQQPLGEPCPALLTSAFYLVW